MAVTEFSRTGYLNGANEPTTWHGRGFGITLEANAPFPGLPVCETAGGRVTTWHEEHPQAIDEAWELDDGSVLVDMRHTDGRLFMRIDSHVSAGYRIWAPYYGRHLVSADGRSIRSALPNVTPWRWQRLFFAQALPLAAALQGLEVFHASAVALRGRVLAFVGAPGAGKTSRSEEHTSELQSRGHLVCWLLLEKKKDRQSVRENLLAYTRCLEHPFS